MNICCACARTVLTSPQDCPTYLIIPNRGVLVMLNHFHRKDTSSIHRDRVLSPRGIQILTKYLIRECIKTVVMDKEGTVIFPPVARRRAGTSKIRERVHTVV
jgi:hypothetical protein